MRTHPLHTTLLAAMLLAGTATGAAAQTEQPALEEDHEIHHPGDAEAAPAPEPAMPDGSTGMQGGMPGMMGMMPPEMMEMMQGMMTPEMREMMTPEMMRMMQGMMMGMMGQRDDDLPAAVMQAEMCAPMMHMMAAMHAGAGMSGMMMDPEMMDPGMTGHGMLYGMPHGGQEEMTPERVRAFLEERLDWHANPRLRIGEIATASDGSITAEIVTVDGSLVQKLAFNRYPGLFRQITE